MDSRTRNTSHALAATEFEFRHRFFVIAFIFFAGFEFYWIDQSATGIWLAQLFRGHPLNLAQAGDRHMLQAIYWAAALVVIVAAWLRTWAAAYLPSRIVHSTLLHQESVIADGPYRHLRNPLYLGGILLAAGIGVAASRSGFCFIVGAVIVFYYRLIFREEPELVAAQGDAYRRFAAAVPRLIPSLRPRLPASGARPEWQQAVRGELFMWLFAASSAIFAATLSGRMFMIATCISVAVAAVNGALIGRQRKRGDAAAPPRGISSSGLLQEPTEPAQLTRTKRSTKE
ncbi:MAG: methyltransferase family protein [Acidobacteriaceae bacterium]